MGAKRAVHAYLSGDAHDGLSAFAAGQGVSVSAVLEILGLELYGHREAGGAGVPLAFGGLAGDEIVSAARGLDVSRRQRATT